MIESGYAGVPVVVAVVLGRGRELPVDGPMLTSTVALGHGAVVVGFGFCLGGGPWRPVACLGGGACVIPERSPMVVGARDTVLSAKNSATFRRYASGESGWLVCRKTQVFPSM